MEIWDGEEGGLKVKENKVESILALLTSTEVRGASIFEGIFGESFVISHFGLKALTSRSSLPYVGAKVTNRGKERK